MFTYLLTYLLRGVRGGGFSMLLLLLLKCCFASTETVGLLGTGAQDSRSSGFEDAPLVDFMYLVRACVRGVHAAVVANSKHWFTTSFLQGGRYRKAMLGECCGGPHLAR